MLSEITRKRFEKIAESLTGKAVIVRVQETYHKGVFGDFSRVGADGVCITLAPRLETEQAYKTFLHECSHVLLGHYKHLIPNGYSLQPSGKGVNYKVYDSGPISTREDKANLLAKQIDIIAARMSWGTFDGESAEKKIIMLEKHAPYIAKLSLELIEEK